VYFYPIINEALGLPVNYKSIVIAAFILLAFLITPLYWRAVKARGLKAKQDAARPPQPWE
jgi:hypothetical protein